MNPKIGNTIKPEFEKAIEKALDSTKFNTINIISRELIFINNIKYEKIVQIRNDKKWITYIHPEGIRQTIISEEYLDRLLDDITKS